MTPQDRQLVDVLIARRLISAEAVAGLALEAARSRRPLAAVVVERGLASPEAIRGLLDGIAEAPTAREWFDRDLLRPLAAKVLLAQGREADAEALARFVAEAQITGTTPSH